MQPAASCDEDEQSVFENAVFRCVSPLEGHATEKVKRAHFRKKNTYAHLAKPLKTGEHECGVTRDAYRWLSPQASMKDEQTARLKAVGNMCVRPHSCRHSKKAQDRFQTQNKAHVGRPGSLLSEATVTGKRHTSAVQSSANEIK